MANHVIILTAGEETIYAKYLEATGLLDVAVMARLKSVLTDQVLQLIAELGHAKFNGLSVEDKIAFLEA